MAQQQCGNSIRRGKSCCCRRRKKVPVVGMHVEFAGKFLSSSARAAGIPELFQ